MSFIWSVSLLPLQLAASSLSGRFIPVRLTNSVNLWGWGELSRWEFRLCNEEEEIRKLRPPLCIQPGPGPPRLYPRTPHVPQHSQIIVGTVGSCVVFCPKRRCRFRVRISMAGTLDPPILRPVSPSPPTWGGDCTAHMSPGPLLAGLHGTYVAGPVIGWMGMSMVLKMKSWKRLPSRMFPHTNPTMPLLPHVSCALGCTHGSIGG